MEGYILIGAIFIACVIPEAKEYYRWYKERKD